MRNQRSNYIPLPSKPAKSTPKPLQRSLLRRTSTTQTERVVLVKEENLSFHSASRLNQGDYGMRRDYVKAVNYINACHKFVNAIIEKNSTADSKGGVFLLPMVTNYSPLFPCLVGKPPCKKVVRRDRKEEEQLPPEGKVGDTRVEDGKIKGSFGGKKVSVDERPIIGDTVPVGDCEKSSAPSKDTRLAMQVADIVKEQIHQFMSTLQNDMHKATKKIITASTKPRSSTNETVKKRLHELSNLCFSQMAQKKADPPSHITQTIFPPIILSTPTTPTPSPAPCVTLLTPIQTKEEERSVILSDTDCEEISKVPQEASGPEVDQFYAESVSSSISESSDIKSDSEMEINPP